MTSAPHLDCTLHNHNHTHIAATHSTFLSEYPGITFHRAGLWCYYTPLFAVYVLIPVGWLYVMPSALNGVVTEWKEKWKVLVMRLLSLFIEKQAGDNTSSNWRGNFSVCPFIHFQKNERIKKNQIPPPPISDTANPVCYDELILINMTLSWPY